jgi:hypothetical protein
MSPPCPGARGASWWRCRFGCAWRVLVQYASASSLQLVGFDHIIDQAPLFGRVGINPARREKHVQAAPQANDARQSAGLPPQPGIRPNWACWSPKRASLAAKMMSQASISSLPPARVRPWQAATTGRSLRSRRLSTLWPYADELLEPGRIAAQQLHLVEVGAGAEMLALRPDQDGAHTGAGLLEFIKSSLDALMNGHRQAIEFFGTGQLDDPDRTAERLTTTGDA